MTATLRGSSTAQGAAASLTPTKPTGTASGDLLLMYVAASGFSTGTTGAVTPPAGWSLLTSWNNPNLVEQRGTWLYKTAGSTEPASWTVAFSDGKATLARVDVFAITGATGAIRSFVTGAGNAGLDAYGGTPPNLASSDYPLTVLAQKTNYDWTASDPVVRNDSGSSGSPGVIALNKANGHATMGGQNEFLTSCLAIGGNVAPNAPAWNTPNNITVPFNQDNVVAWAFSDDDAGDSQSAFNIKRWTLDGTGARVGAPVTVYAGLPQQQYTIPANTLTSGTKYEFQVDTLDSQGFEGPYSSSLFLTAVTPPPGPVLTDPVNGATIGTSSYAGVISAPNVDVSEWTLYADNNGVIDTSTVLHGPVTVTPSTGDVRQHGFEGLANNVPVWWSVRVQYQGQWSPPTTARTPVSYAAPAVPVVTLMADSANGAMVVGINNPAPTGDQPAAAYNNVWIDDGDGSRLIRKAVNLPTNRPWTYWLPPSGFDGITSGLVQVEAVAVNGVTSMSAAPTPAPVYEDLDGGTATTAGADFLDGGSI